MGTLINKDWCSWRRPTALPRGCTSHQSFPDQHGSLPVHLRQVVVVHTKLGEQQLILVCCHCALEEQDGARGSGRGIVCTTVRSVDWKQQAWRRTVHRHRPTHCHTCMHTCKRSTVRLRGQRCCADSLGWCITGCDSNTDWHSALQAIFTMGVNVDLKKHAAVWLNM